MAISKKGKRKIKFEKDVFYWLFNFQYQKDILTLRVMTDEKSNSHLLCNFNYREPFLSDAPEPLDNWILTPKIVNQAIQYATKKGWNPHKKEKHFVLNEMDIKLGIREKANYDWTYVEFAMWIMTQPKDSSIKAINLGFLETENGYSACITGSKTYSEENDYWLNNEDYIPRQKYFDFPKVFIEGKNLQSIQNDFVQLVKDFLNFKNFRISILAIVSVITIKFDDNELIRIV